MSLDLDICERANGIVLWTENITHNYVHMATAADTYEAVWHPEKFDSDPAKILPRVADGLATILKDRRYFEGFEPDNGWGDYEGFVTFLSQYALALTRYRDAVVEASR